MGTVLRRSPICLLGLVLHRSRHKEFIAVLAGSGMDFSLEINCFINSKSLEIRKMNTVHVFTIGFF